MLYTKVLDEYKIDYEEYLREREVDFFGMKDRYLKYIQTKGITLLPPRCTCRRAVR